VAPGLDEDVRVTAAAAVIEALGLFADWDDVTTVGGGFIGGGAALDDESAVEGSGAWVEGGENVFEGVVDDEEVRGRVTVTLGDMIGFVVEEEAELLGWVEEVGEGWGGVAMEAAIVMVMGTRGWPTIVDEEIEGCVSFGGGAGETGHEETDLLPRLVFILLLLLGPRFCCWFLGEGIGEGGGADVVEEMMGAVATAMRYLDVDEAVADAVGVVPFNASREARKQFSDLGRGRFTLARALVSSRMSQLSLFLDLEAGGGVGAKSTSSSSWAACSLRAVTMAETDWSSLAATKFGFFPILFSLGAEQIRGLLSCMFSAW
jgi:hypothetical protein